MKVTACLLSWKRPEGIIATLPEIRKQSIVDDIILWNNNPEVIFDDKFIKDNDVNLINSDKNYLGYGRYLASKYAKHDLIYTQDDDWFPLSIEDLALSRSPDQILAYTAPTHNTNKPVHKWLGWGAIFHKSMTKVMDLYLENFEEDFLFYRECDLILTNMNPYKKVLMDPSVVVKNDKRSLCMQPLHYWYHEEMIKKINKLKELIK